MSFSLTTEQFRQRSKTVTRRLGWDVLKPGDRVMGCEKVMGRRKGEPLVRLGEIEIVSVRREPLRAMSDDVKYGFAEVLAEGFGEHKTLRWPSVWVEWFANSNGCELDTTITRIEFRYV